MKSGDFVKEGDWIVPNNIETPKGPETEPLFHKILRQLESTTDRVTVEMFATEVAKTMKELEDRMRMLTLIH